MAILGRHTLETLTDAVRLHTGEKLTGYSRFDDDQTATQKWSIYRQLNNYLQNIRQHMLSRIRAEGVSIRHGELFLDCYRTNGTLSVSSGSSTAYLPENCDGVIAFWDATNLRKLNWVDHPTNYHITKSRRSVAGPPELLVLEGYADNSGTWQRRVIIYPSTVSGVTPSITVEYYRIPEQMDESNPTTTTPDIDPQFQDALVYGVTASMMGTAHPSYNEFRTKETELLLAMARHYRVAA